MHRRVIETGGEFPNREQLTGLGELAFLFLRAPNYARIAVADLRIVIEPPVDTGHFALMRQNGVPRALLTWAYMSDEVEARHLTGTA